MDPISRSANPFCHGERGAIGLSRMPMARRRCLTIEPKTRSRSRMRYPGADFQGKASVIWRAIHSAVGLFVTPIQTSSRRASRTRPSPGVGGAAKKKEKENKREEEGRGPQKKKAHRRDLWCVIAQKG